MVKVVIKKSTGCADTFFVYESADSVHPEGPCIAVYESLTELIFNEGFYGEQWLTAATI